MVIKDNVYRGGPGGINPDGGNVGDGYIIGGDMIGAAIGSAAMLYDSYQNRKNSKEIARLNNEAAKKEAELAYQRELEMWNMRNAYESPEQQMARMRAAGLNPHLMYQQGNAGVSGPAPSYTPARQEHNYAPTQYGAAFASILPTLMSVGSWMQDMRLSEADLRSKTLGGDRAEQMIEYLRQKNPQLLQEGANRLSLFPYQKDATKYGAMMAHTKLQDMNQEFRYKFGDDLFEGLWNTPGNSWSPQGGVRRLQFLEEQSKQQLAEAKASWSQFDVTDPQQIMMLVLNGVMGLAGQTLRLSTHRGAKSNAAKEMDELKEYRRRMQRK